MMSTITMGMEDRAAVAGALLCQWDDYLKARGSKDNPLCRCDGGKWMMMMGLMMALVADRMW